MMKTAIIAALIASVVANESPAASDKKMQKPVEYNFNYKVNDDPSCNYFGHFERKHKDGTVCGEYYVYLPDRRTQIVTYIVTKNGYRANVKYLDGNKERAH